MSGFILHEVNISGLKLPEAVTTLERFKEEKNRKYQIVSIALGVTAGIIAGIAQIAFSAHYLLNASGSYQIYHVYLDRGVGYIRQRSWQPTNPWTFSLAVLSLVFGPFTFGPSVGFAVYGLGQLLRIYKTEQVAKTIQQLKRTYNNNDNAFIDESDIHTLMQLCDNQVRKNMLKKMNFEQLTFAKTALGDKIFHTLIADLQGEQFNMCRLLTKKDLNVEDITESVRNIAGVDPYVANALHQKARKTNNASLIVLTHRLLFSQIISTPDVNDKIIELVTPHGNIPVSASLLCRNSKYFNALLTKFKQNDTVEKKGSCKLEIEQEHFTTLNTYLNLLQGKPVLLDKQTVLQVAECALFYSDERVLPGLAKYAVANSQQFTQEELISLVQKSLLPERSGLTTLRKYFQRKYECKALTAENWEDFWDVATKLRLPALKARCTAFATEYATNAMEGRGNLIKALDFILTSIPEGDQAFYMNRLIQRIHAGNICQILTLAEKHKNKDLHEQCLTYCRRNGDDLRQNLPWDFHQIPPTFAEILYPFPEKMAVLSLQAFS